MRINHFYRESCYIHYWKSKQSMELPFLYDQELQIPPECCTARRHMGPWCHPQQSRHLHLTWGLLGLEEASVSQPVPTCHLSCHGPVGQLAVGRALSCHNNTKGQLHLQAIAGGKPSILYSLFCWKGKTCTLLHRVGIHVTTWLYILFLHQDKCGPGQGGVG